MFFKILLFVAPRAKILLALGLIVLSSCSLLTPPLPESQMYRNWVQSTLNQYRVDVESQTWMSVPISDRVGIDNGWKIIVEVAGERFSLELIDSQTHYLRSGWKTESHPHPSHPDWSLLLRSRVFCRYSESERAFKFKVEAQVWWWNEWIGSRYISKEDYTMLEEIRGRLSG